MKLTTLLADGTTHPFPGHVQNTVNSVDSKTGKATYGKTVQSASRELANALSGCNNVAEKRKQRELLVKSLLHAERNLFQGELTPARA